MVWCFIGVYIKKEHYMATWGYEISLLVLKKYFIFNTQREISYLRTAM